jgi:hypothetical protein
MAFPRSALQEFPTDYWGNESRVNGVWNNLLAAHFQSDKFVVCPESVLDTSGRRLRADLNVLQISPPRRDVTPAAFSMALTFEGKKEGVVVRNIDDLIAQLQTYATTVHRNSPNFYCIGAVGKMFKLFVKTGSDSIVGLNMSTSGGKPTVSGRGGATSATAYDIITDYDRLILTLQWLALNTFPRTTDF